MAGFKMDDKRSTIAEINIVPFVDIILVVLIIFMVTTPIIMKPNIEIALPTAQKAKSAVKSSELIINVGKDKSVYMNDKPVDRNELKLAVAKFKQENMAVNAIINADKDLSHGFVVKIIDIVKSVGIKKVGISVDTAQ